MGRVPKALLSLWADWLLSSNPRESKIDSGGRVAPVQVPFPDYDEGAPGPSQLGTGERWMLQPEKDYSSKTPQGPELRLGSRVSRNCGVRQSHSSICRELPSLRAQ